MAAENERFSHKKQARPSKLSQEALNEILISHQEWYENRGQKGSRANLQYQDLRNADLHGKNLAMAYLQGANLKGANLTNAFLFNAYLDETDLRGSILTGADLRYASLARCDFSGADLHGATMANVDLQDSFLEGTIGLRVTQLSGADLSNARLPPAIAEFDAVKPVQDALKAANRTLLFMVLGCAYALLTMYTIDDLSLLTNTHPTSLPIIGTPLPILGFYVVGPLLLVLAYLYFHLYAQVHLWEHMKDLPSVFPDGNPLNMKLFPSFMVGLGFTPYFMRRSTPRLSSKIQSELFEFVVWLTVPITLILLWARYLSRHDLLGAVYQGFIIALALVVGIYSTIAHGRTMAEPATLAADTIDLASLRPARNAIALIWGSVLFLAILSPIVILSAGVVYGVPPEIYDHPITRERAMDFPSDSVLRIVPWLLSRLNLHPYADFAELEVSERPQNWSGTSDDQIALVRGAKLKHQNLSYADARRSFLVKADLRHSWLVGIDLESADLRGAGLQSAALGQASMQYANLQGADLSFAWLINTDLSGANVQSASLVEANLQGAKLYHVRGLSDDALKASHNWALASYDETELVSLSLPPDHNYRLQSKDLDHYHLERVDLSYSDLRGFTLEGVDLQQSKVISAKLQGADLRNAMLQRSDLSHSDLSFTDLDGANLSDAILYSAHLDLATLRGVDLSRAVLSQAELAGAQLQNANLEGSLLTGADLRYANLEGANLTNANLSGANLQYTMNLTSEQIHSAIIDGATLLPSYLQTALQKTQGQ